MTQEVNEPIETAARKSLALLIQEQAADLTRLIAEGQFPLWDQPCQNGDPIPHAVRFNLILGWKAAIERVDAVWREMVRLRRERNSKGFTQEEIELLWKALEALETDEGSSRVIQPIKEKLEGLAFGSRKEEGHE